MEDYYCLNLKFKNSEISDEIFHAHLYYTLENIYIKIIDNISNSQINRMFMSSSNALGYFEDNFEIIESDVNLIFEKSRIYEIQSLDEDGVNNYFTIYVNNICLVKPNFHKELINEGMVYLNDNGLKMVNQFYSFFRNLLNKNVFSISRMNGMSDFYSFDCLRYRPELEFTNNERRNSKEFTIKKIATLNFTFKDIDYHQLKKYNEIICSFLSFCFGVRIEFNKMVYRTEDSIYTFIKTKDNNKQYVSDFFTVFTFLNKNYKIQNILKTNWGDEYLRNTKKISKAIENYLHSREVELSASYLLLFNIIEIFNVKLVEEKFAFNDQKDENIKRAFELIKSSLLNSEDGEQFKNKWDGLINKFSIKPLKSPLEETLKYNNIKAEDFGYTFNELKSLRDKLTHGSVNSIKEEDLKSSIYSLRKIAICLILSQLGFKENLKTSHNTA